MTIVSASIFRWEVQCNRENLAHSRGKDSVCFDKLNPVVVASLCCVYGNDICKRILKPKKEVEKTKLL